MLTELTAAGLAGIAGALAWRPSPMPRHAARLLPLAATVAVSAGLLMLPGAGPPALVLAGLALAGRGLHGRARARARAAETGGRVQLACDGLASALSAGAPTDSALEAAAGDWPPIAGVVAAHRLGGSVPEALRDLADEPGAGDVRLVAAAWQVAHRSGAGLAPALSDVAALLRRREGTRRLVRSELASARATARLLAGLPVFTLVLGAGVGGDPVRFLLGTTPGLLCLSGGLGLGVVGLWWIEAIAGSVEAES